MMRLFWTFFVAVICIGVISIPALDNLLLHHPELHFCTLGGALLLSTFTGKTLVEQRNWSWLMEAPASDPDSKTPSAKS